MTVFEAYITNLGKYAEGQLVGETLKFPATTEEVQSLLKNIGVDGVRYEEFFITAFDGDVMGLYDYLTEYENLDELNHLAHLISELDSFPRNTPGWTVSSGRKVARPAFSLRSRAMPALAAASFSTTMFCRAPPSAVSMATSRPGSTRRMEDTGPMMPRSRRADAARITVLTEFW